MSSKSNDPRTSLAIGLVAWLALAGCTIFPDTPAKLWYQLDDAAMAHRAALPATSDAQEAMPPTRRLVLSPARANALYDSTGIVHGRDPGIRATYQFASWTERPSRRLVDLLEARLSGRDPALRRFASVAGETSGVRADWLLSLRIVEFYHDTSTQPDRALVEVDAELIDWQDKAIIDRRRFRIERPLKSEDVGGAVAALGSASSALLDQIVAWLDAQADRPTGRKVPRP